MRSYNFVIPSVLPSRDPTRHLVKKITRIFYNRTEWNIEDEDKEYLRARREALDSYLKSLIKFYKPNDVNFWNHPLVLQFFELKPICIRPALLPFDNEERLGLLNNKTGPTTSSKAVSTSNSKPGTERILATPKEMMALQDVQITEIGCHVKSQKEIAAKIYDEVVLQNALLENISEKVSSVSTTMEKQETRIQKKLL